MIKIELIKKGVVISSDIVAYRGVTYRYNSPCVYFFEDDFKRNDYEVKATLNDKNLNTEITDIQVNYSEEKGNTFTLTAYIN